MFGKMFFVSVILLQVFTFGLGRSLQWLFAPWIGKVGRRWLMGISYFITNGLLIGLLLELGHMMFRVVAFWMVILLFVMYAALVTFILRPLQKSPSPNSRNQNKDFQLFSSQITPDSTQIPP